MTRRKVLEYWTETHRVVGDEVKVLTCCCPAAGATAKECQTVKGTKTRCACFCHSKLTEKQARTKRIEREEKAGKFYRWNVTVKRVNGKREVVKVKMWCARTAAETMKYFGDKHPYLTFESAEPMGLIESAGMDWRKDGIEI